MDLALAYTQRRRDIISGLIALIIVFGMIAIGVNYSFGYFDDGYQVHGTFDAAGQGLIEGSDIKIRGVDVGHVAGVALRDGQADVTMFINQGIEIPANSVATIRPKTLFGEKFIDISRGDESSMLEAGDSFGGEDDCGGEACTRGGFELEQVLGDAYPVLQAIDSDDLFTIIDGLAEGADGLGEAVGRTIENSAELADQAAGRDAEFRELLRSLDRISGELAGRADDVVTGARRLNLALPVLAENGDDLTALLEQLQRLSSEVSDVLTTNQAFVESVFTLGQRVLDTLDANSTEIIPLVIGLRQFFQLLGEVGRHEVGDGTRLAAVQGILGGEVCPLLPFLPACFGADSAAAEAPAAVLAPPAPTGTGPTLPDLGLGPITGELSRGTQALFDLLGGVLGGAR
jgi:virulence factor Mce-like protein